MSFVRVSVWLNVVRFLFVSLILLEAKSIYRLEALSEEKDSYKIIKKIFFSVDDDDNDGHDDINDNT